MRLFTILPFGVTLSVVPAAAQQSRPPIRQLGPVVAKANETFVNIGLGVRALSGGRVLVNDAPRRRVLLFDSTLTSFTVVADSTAATGNAYSGRFAGLIAYRGDSTLFVDPTSLSMLVIDPAGKVGRVMSVPRADDVGSLVGGPIGGSVGFDASGRLVYRAFRPPRPTRSPEGHMVPPEIPDTAPIVRVDLATRQMDTVGFIKTQRPNMQMSRDADGRMSMSMTLNPLPVVDEWAILADGSIAFVRGRDYHVDWVNPDGTRSSSPKLPFEWQRLSDEDKVAFIDSVKAARERMGAAGGAPQIFVSGGPAPAGSAAPAPGAGDRVAVTIVQGGSPPAGGAQRGGDAPRGPRDGPAPRVNFVSPSELPDYKPPFFAGSVRADADGNLWIRTIPTKAISGGPVYDVVNRQGGLVDRVQVPAGRTIVGFGPGGVVYMVYRDGDATYLERARVR
ncbi:MAG: hypothetical protein ABR499_20575 [Gemmatimonadaceae bacterium]